MVTIILAAGYGTRLYPLTLNNPKALLEVGGKTILDRLFRQIELTHACEKAFVVTNEKFHKSFETWADSKKSTVPIVVLNDRTKSNKTRLGAIGDINLVLEKGNLKGKEDLLITGSDNLFDIDMKDFVKFGESRGPSCSIALFDVRDIRLSRQYGICSLDEKLEVTDFEEKPEKPKSTLVATALYFIPKESVLKIFEYMKTDLSKDAPGNLMKWFAKIDKLFGYVIEGAWYDIGDKKSLKKADAAYRKKEKGKK